MLDDDVAAFVSTIGERAANECLEHLPMFVQQNKPLKFANTLFRFFSNLQGLLKPSHQERAAHLPNF
ncbi:hypothetical protein B0181_11425 [Moraxella caviae]|uniref:Uncharacterized protein n=1 Tax=Moraxella caviae TaxID=34060 RepID=A0A1S9ZTN2_9GAMM|nr:hypothetical protein B0181_11425 [Moraxella caviae]